MTASFKTSSIPVSSDEYSGLVAHLEQFRVHPTGFYDADGVSLYDRCREEPIDGNQVYGEPIKIEVDKDKGTVIFSGEGTFHLARIENNFGYSTMSPVVGHFLEDILSARFMENRKGVSVVVECLVDGVKETEIINMDLYHQSKGEELVW